MGAVSDHRHLCENVTHIVEWEVLSMPKVSLRDQEDGLGSSHVCIAASKVEVIAIQLEFGAGSGDEAIG